MKYETRENLQSLIFCMVVFLFPIMILYLSPNIPVAVETNYFYGYVLIVVEFILLGVLLLLEF